RARLPPRRGRGIRSPARAGRRAGRAARLRRPDPRLLRDVRRHDRRAPRRGRRRRRAASRLPGRSPHPVSEGVLVRSLTPYRAAIRVAAIAAAGALFVTACTPGSTSNGASTPTKSATTGVGSAPVTLKLLVTSGVDVPFFTALGKLFHAKHANVTVQVTSQDYGALTTNIAHILS